jgi:protein PhnA
MGDDDYVYDEASGEYLPGPVGRRRPASEDAVVVRDAVGNGWPTATR